MSVKRPQLQDLPFNAVEDYKKTSCIVYMFKKIQTHCGVVVNCLNFISLVDSSIQIVAIFKLNSII